MNNTFFLIASILIFFYVVTTKFTRWKSGNVIRLPPGPYPLLIIGNIFELGEKPHISLASLSKIYGGLMTLKLGSIITIVVSSPEIAKEILLKHDLSFSSRSVPDTGRVVNHHLFSVVWLPVGDQWRRLRRISKQHLFSVQQLDDGQLLRREKIQKLVDHVHECCTSQKPINIGRAAFTTSLNVLSNFIFSTDMAPYDSVESQEFKDAVSGLADVVGKPNLADFFPLLKPFDPQGLLREANVHAEKLMAILDRMIDQRVQARAKSSAAASSTNDVLDLLLDLSAKNESEFSRNDILHFLFDLFAAATDTTTSTLEWAMAELIHNPEKMAKARSELEEITGNANIIIEESDICKLPYLEAVVKETLRLHPPVPFLLPHKALCDVEIQGFVVPKDAQILCNVWAIGRDPSIWSDPHEFMPERFLDVNIDYKGRDFELIPFGSGRRICPGLPLAHRMLHLMLGSLIRKFDWKLEPEDMDMSERFGITLHKSVPLVANPIKI
ncbi:geraniol 8-hydroxylase-like [Cynara cardunculus var. scolymus]|uniref:geraniol 8-hydroxylase-like n=1 Tax=Cynara cardunculus var. scolymus TaxID=59895 RepID=UPI000D628261|nr:geraniol 8-hydroxylase-like [Cynara cardunculus var. scolymus]